LAHVPDALVPGLAESVAENMSLYDVLQNRFGLRSAKVRATYFVLPAEPFGVPVAAPIFLCRAG